jgi:hypothetical protein
MALALALMQARALLLTAAKPRLALLRGAWSNPSRSFIHCDHVAYAGIIPCAKRINQPVERCRPTARDRMAPSRRADFTGGP